MREEVHYYARAHALLVAKQKDLFHIAEFPAVHGEDDFVDDVPAQQFRQLRQRIRLVALGQLDLAGRFVEETHQPDAVIGRLLQGLSQMQSAFARSHYHHEMRRAKFSAYGADHTRGVDAEQAQQNPGVHPEQRDERAAQVEAQQVFGYDDADGSHGALPEGVAQDHARVRRVELFVDVEPIADGDPAENRNHQQRRRDGKIEVEVLLQVQPDARLVSGEEGQGSKEYIGDPEDCLDFSIVAAEHSGNSITCAKIS